MTKTKKLSKRIIALIVAGIFIAILGFTVLGFFIGYWVVGASVYVWHPNYEMLTDDELKEAYDNDDYQTLFKQTGLTEIGIQRAKKQSDGFNRVRSIQQSYFEERGVQHAEYAPLICTDFQDGSPAVPVYLERGDIIITSSTHFAGFKIGHSAIVTSEYGGIYQSSQVGAANGYNNFSNVFSMRVNFMVVRIKPEYFSEKAADGSIDYASYTDNLRSVTEYISGEFGDVPYNPTTGVFTAKDSMAATTCSHLIWYGFKHFDDANGGKFNLDLDPNGGLLVLPKDISLSPYVELVQTFGFDPAVMYD